MDPQLVAEQVAAYPYTLVSAGLTDTGLVRERNEDAFGSRLEHGFYVLADGMGGHKGGDIAAQETVSGLLKRVESELPPLPQSSDEARAPAEKVAYWLRRAIEAINLRVYERGRGDPSLRGMGATLCCLLLCGREIVYAHVGDSRIYRLRGGKLARLTEDHSLVTELLKLGRITEKQAQNFIYRHVITRAMGTRTSVEPDIAWDTAESGDLYLMCSDGLTDLVDDAQLETLLQSSEAVEVLAHALVNAALTSGGKDNVTVVLLKVCNGKSLPDLSR